MSEVRLGLIGIGRHGTRYARHLLDGDIEGARLSAICRRDRAAGEALAEEWSVGFHGDARSLAGDPEVDAVLVVSPARHHPEAVEAASAAGKPVLVEKPLAFDAAGCDVIAAAAAASGIPVMVAQTTRYEGAMRGLLSALPSIGPVRQASFVLRCEDRTHDASGLFQPVLDDGGAILDAGVHYFDLLRCIVGEIEAVWCEGYHFLQTPIDDGYTAVLSGVSGARVVVSVGRWGNSRHESIEVAGEEGILLLSRTPPSLSLVEGREEKALPFPDVPGTLPVALLDFVRVCRAEIEPPITIEDGKAAVALVDACRRSSGRWVRLSSG